jgi:hypothetical protein
LCNKNVAILISDSTAYFPNNSVTPYNFRIKKKKHTAPSENLPTTPFAISRLFFGADYHRSSQFKELSQAAYGCGRGAVSAAACSPPPPGVPYLAPGEMI